jgi:hypothetical protein
VDNAFNILVAGLGWGANLGSFEIVYFFNPSLRS